MASARFLQAPGFCVLQFRCASVSAVLFLAVYRFRWLGVSAAVWVQCVAIPGDGLPSLSLENIIAMDKNKNKESQGRVAVFAGSFDPFTVGHDDIARRALRLFDRLVIVVARNPEKHYMFTAEERVEAISKLYRDEPRVSVVAYGGMIVDIAAEVGARFQVRGVRTSIDFEYERVEAEFNDKLGGLETVLLYSKPQFSTISSTAYRTLVYFHKDEEAREMLPISH